MHRVATELANEYGIDMTKHSYNEVIDIARNLARLREELGRPVKVGDPLPSETSGKLKNFSHYYQDLQTIPSNVPDEFLKLSSPREPGLGGGYSYRGEDPYPAMAPRSFTNVLRDLFGWGEITPRRTPSNSEREGKVTNVRHTGTRGMNQTLTDTILKHKPIGPTGGGGGY
jgi:hypothetical protein